MNLQVKIPFFALGLLRVPVAYKKQSNWLLVLLVVRHLRDSFPSGSTSDPKWVVDF